MTNRFEPFTPEAFKEQTAFDARDNEAVYLRWVNSQINYANYLAMKEMVSSLKEIRLILKEIPSEERGKALGMQ